MRAHVFLPAAALLAASTLGAQPPRWRPELRPFVGTSIPTGGLREVVGSEAEYGLALAAELRPWLHALGTVGVTPASTRFVVPDRGMRVLQYDVGLEVNASQPFAGPWQLHPFWGAGVGARSYRYDDAALTDRTCASGYLATGVELQAGRVALRAEGRDNVFCWRAPIGDARTGVRNDLGLALGMAYHFR